MSEFQAAKNFGLTVREQRKKRGLSSAEFIEVLMQAPKIPGKFIGRPPSKDYLSRIENGHRTRLSVAEMAWISQSLNQQEKVVATAQNNLAKLLISAFDDSRRLCVFNLGPSDDFAKSAQFNQLLALSCEFVLKSGKPGYSKSQINIFLRSRTDSVLIALVALYGLYLSEIEKGSTTFKGVEDVIRSMKRGVVISPTNVSRFRSLLLETFSEVINIFYLNHEIENSGDGMLREIYLRNPGSFFTISPRDIDLPVKSFWRISNDASGEFSKDDSEAIASSFTTLFQSGTLADGENVETVLKYDITDKLSFEKIRRKVFLDWNVII